MPLWQLPKMRKCENAKIEKYENATIQKRQEPKIK